MANRFLGEATVEADGTTYTLRCDLNALAEFETETGENALAVIERFETGKVGVKTMRAMMWAFLRRHHPETTILDAGDILSADVNSLMVVIQATNPTAKEVEGLGNARKARAKVA